MRMGRLLEGGAHGIMYPRCDDGKEAAEVVKWAKFPPLGKRGFDGGNPDHPYCALPMGEYTRKANEETFLIIQMEEQHAVDQAERIGEVEGVDILFLGPGDFTSLSGIPGQMDHPKLWKAYEAVAKAAEKTGKYWGTPAFNPEHARKLMDMGALFFCHTADLVILKQGLEQIIDKFSPLGFEFDNHIAADGKSYLQG
jgi:4-hydroxy-2-oxoheptanedioate aldolase